MKAQILIRLFLGAVFAIKVQCVQEVAACPRRESLPGVLILTSGKEVVMSCRGEVTVDGLISVIPIKKERLRKRRDITDLLTTQIHGENSATTEAFHSASRNDAILHIDQNVTATGLDTAGKEDSLTTIYPPAITTEEHMRTGRVLSTINQHAQPTRSSRQEKEGVETGVTMETGTKSKRTTSMEYEDYEDYEDEEQEEEEDIGLRVTRAIKKRASWTRNGHSVRKGVERGGVLRITNLQFTDSGNYSCYRGDKLMSSFKIIVGVAPETPTLTCHKKSHISKVRCEWTSGRPIVPHPQCYMSLRKGMETFSRVPCSYSVKRSRCWCLLPSDEIDRNYYIAEMCVTNIVGNATSQPLKFIPLDIIKPDPPIRVLVQPAEGQLHTLRVSWAYPATWRQGFYYLQFQLKYRPLQAQEYQQEEIEGTKLSWLIVDALPHFQYEVQLRAKDEFAGLWSEWTSPVYAYTWIGPRTTTASDYNSLEPFWTFEGSGGSEEELKSLVIKADEGSEVMWMYTLWVFGLSVLITLTMLSVYSLRHRVLFKGKKCKLHCSPPCSRSSASPPPPPVLQQPLVVPQQHSQQRLASVHEEEEQGIHLHNMDYFLSHSD